MVWRPHVTVAAVLERDGKFLLVEEKIDEQICYNQPAGHLECGESLTDAVVRETLEETARRFEPSALVGVYMSRFQRPGRDEDVTYLRFAFCGTVGEVEPGRALDKGIVRTLWLTPEEIRACRARHRSPLLLRCVEDHLAGRRYPLEVLVADPTLFEPEIKAGRHA